MIDHEARDGTRSAFTDSEVRSYLLCSSTEDERAKLETALMVDDELAERVLLAEAELTDDFVAENLDAADRENFETKFLVTSARLQRLRVSLALRELAKDQAVPSASAFESRRQRSWIHALAGRLGLDRHPVMAIGTAFAMLLLAVGATVLLVNRFHQIQPTIVRHEPIPAQEPEPSPVPTVPPVDVPTSGVPALSPTKEPEKLPTPATPPARPVIATTVLLPGALRGGGDMARVALPAGARDVVRLKLVVEPDGMGNYSAEVLTAEGVTVLSRKGLRVTKENSEISLVLDVPARLLKVGDYQIRLSRQQPGAAVETLGRYYFRAIQK